MPNPFIHSELATTDVRKAKAFYSKLFTWKLNDMPMPGPAGKYTIIETGDGPGSGGGMLKQMMPDAPSAWMPYVLVDDIQASTKKAVKLGARLMKDVTEVQGMGWLSVVEDPTGAVIGLWQTKAESPARKVPVKKRRAR